MGKYNRPKHFGKIVIMKPDPEDGTKEIDYLRRWYLFRCKWFSIRLHHIIEPDTDRAPHDHPWPFVSFVLKGGYVEVWSRQGNPSPTQLKTVMRLSFHRRSDVHKILRFVNPQRGAWTLIFTGIETREMVAGKSETRWGFETPDGWVPWWDYLSA